ncbi:hypothetical protein GBAR_LOCUS27466 [Geodia barretti]|uniref:Uncharacterized protein n=1 Tax=Geodia barretti TaxID=519541 RepID=A0AA35TMT8_GEOBA|nr:hypothetical protein GBAR_LOCUS27466 [Geodia barretti]
MATSGAGQPERQLSVASAASLGTSSVEGAAQGAGTSDAHSIGSFDSDDGLDYINMHGYTKNGSHILPSPDSALPLPIPPLESCNAVVTGSADNEPGLNAQSGSGQSSPSADTQSRPPTLPSTVSSMEAGNQSQDGVAGGNQDAPSSDGVLVTASSEEALYEDTAATSRDGPSDSGTVAEGSHEIVYSNAATGSKHGPSGNGTVTAEILYQNTTAEPDDKPLDNGAMAIETGEMLYQNTIRETWDDPLGNETKDVDMAEREEILYQNTSTEPKDDESGNQTLAEHQAGDETFPARDNVSTSHPHLPDKNTHPQVDTNKSPSKAATTTGDKVKPRPAPKPSAGATKTKPAPPPRKPKPKRQSTVEKPVNDKQATSPSPYPPPTSPPTHRMRISNTTPSSPPNSVRDISSSIDKKLKISIPPVPGESPPLPPRDSKSATENEDFSSGDEYVPSDYETDGEREPEKKEEKEMISAGDRETTSPPPPIPLRTKNYHLVVLDKGKSKEEATKQSNTNKESMQSPNTSPVKVVESTNKDNGTADKNKDSVKSPKRKRRFYDAWKLKGEKSKKVHSEPKSPVKARSPPKETKEPQKKKGLNYSQSDRQGTRLKPVRRAPSDTSSSTRPPVVHMSLPREPRATFLNMRTRPLPEAPFVLPHSPPPEHTLEDYDIVDVMFPTSQSFDSSRLPQLLGAPGLPSNLMPGTPNSPFHTSERQRSQSHDVLSADNMDYLNEDQFPRPSPSASVHPLSAASVRSLPAPTYPLPSSPFPTIARHAGQQPLASGWNPFPTQFNQSPAQFNLSPAQFNQSPAQFNLSPAQFNQPPAQFNQSPAQFNQSPAQFNLSPAQFNQSPMQSLPPSSFQRPFQPVSEPAHPPGVPHPLPPSARQPPHHIALGRSTSNPNRGQSPPSPDYSYPRIPLDLTRMLPSQLQGAPSIAIANVRNPRTTYGIPRSKSTEEEEYVQMKRLSGADDTDDQQYVNHTMIESIRDTKRSRSMEDLYQNFPVKHPTVFDRTLPLPSRSTQPAPTQQTFVLPPRNLLRNPASLSPPPLQSHPPVKSLPSFTNQLPSQDSVTPAQMMQPRCSPRPTPRTQREQLSSFPPLHAQHVVTTSPLPSPPAPRPPYDNRQKGSNFKPPVEPPRSLPVGTSTWTADDDPNYYNVVSKSFLFSKPKLPMSLKTAPTSILFQTETRQLVDIFSHGAMYNNFECL